MKELKIDITVRRNPQGYWLINIGKSGIIIQSRSLSTAMEMLAIEIDEVEVFESETKH
jgi:hypothetical protein